MKTATDRKQAKKAGCRFRSFCLGSRTASDRILSTANSVPLTLKPSVRVSISEIFDEFAVMRKIKRHHISMRPKHEDPLTKSGLSLPNCDIAIIEFEEKSLPFEKKIKI